MAAGWFERKGSNSARHWIHSAPKQQRRPFAFSSVFILLLWPRETRHKFALENKILFSLLDWRTRSLRTRCPWCPWLTPRIPTWPSTTRPSTSATSGRSFLQSLCFENYLFGPIWDFYSICCFRIHVQPLNALFQVAQVSFLWTGKFTSICRIFSAYRLDHSLRSIDVFLTSICQIKFLPSICIYFPVCNGS